MRITFGTGRSAEHRRQFREWWGHNGLVGTDPVGSIQVDTKRRTITFSRLVREPVPGDVDFPELRRDIENDPLTEEVTVDLLVDPPAFLWVPQEQSQVA